MARRVRIEYAGACYHVINRGNYRRDLFSRRGAAQAFVTCLGETCEAFGWRVHGYVVMSNHFHLAVETPEPNLSLGMKWLQGTWTTRFNRFRGIAGRPFQGRFKALHVEPGHSLAQVAHYIHLNPVRAGLVPADRLLEHAWSSLPLFTVGPRPAYLDPSTILRESGGLGDTAAGWRCYLGYLALLAEEDAALRERRFGRLSSGWAIGSADFRQQLLQQALDEDRRTERFTLLGADRAAHEDARAVSWEESLRGLAARHGIDLNQLPRLKSAPEKLRLASAMKSATSVSNRWLAQRLQMGSVSSVATFIRRFRAAEHATTSAPMVLSRVVT